MKHLGDITKINGAKIPVVDIVTGGSPCQDLSVAGKRAGLQHSDLGDEETTRSGLFMDQLRIVKEMRESDRRKGRNGVDVRPRYMVWENVPGAFSSNGGKDFQAVLTEIARIVEPNCPDVPMPERGGGLKQGASTVRWETGLLPIGSTMLNIGEFRSEESGLLSLPISTDSQLQKFCLTLNCGEKPRIPNPTKLSEILEQNVDEKYNLSARACQGILNRAAKRGKELPKALLDALTEQSASKNEQGDQGGQRNPYPE